MGTKLKAVLLFATCFDLTAFRPCTSTILYPRDSETRQVKSLDGVWDFRVSSDVSAEEDAGFRDNWFASSFEGVRECFSVCLMEKLAPCNYL